MRTHTELALPGDKLAAGKMPGHWLLARLGKRVLRPGGLELTRCMLEALSIHSSDAIVEFAAGLGVTTRLALNRHPASYTGIEEDEAAATQVRCLLQGSDQQCLVASAEETSLPQNSATVVYGEALLTMQASTQQCQIIREAARLLKPGGRYGIHELCLVPDDLDDSIKEEIQHALSKSIHVGARPLTAKEWSALLVEEGLEITAETLRPMRLLEADRLVQDEGLRGAARFAWNLCRDREARRRVSAMRRVFMKFHSHLAAIMLVGVKTTQQYSN
jgi:SAM-dependent methyltransferase